MATESNSRPSAPPLTRRTLLLLTAVGGTIGGSTVGAAALQWWFGQPDGQQQTGRSLLIPGGNDASSARPNALRVWEQTPTTRRAGLSARYKPVGASSTQQIAAIVNLLEHEQATDLVVIDPEYLPGLVGKGLLRPFTAATSQMLSDFGCIPTLVERCRVAGELYAVPLNADTPMLVIDLSTLPETAVPQVDALQGIRQPREFWTKAAAIARSAPARKNTLLLEAGDYEGLTVCLVELIHAFGGDVDHDPTLATQHNRDALLAVWQALPRSTFQLPPGNGDEPAVQSAVQDHRTACARLWPVQCINLTSGEPRTTSGKPVTEESRGYRIMPIPGGVLGGQVLALAKQSSNEVAAERLARYLAQPLSQLQLFHNGGYVPTLTELYLDLQVHDRLGDLTHDPDLDLTRYLTTAVHRPAVNDYVGWSNQFRNAVRAFLLDRTGNSSLAAITTQLAKYTHASAEFVVPSTERTARADGAG